MAGEDHRPDGTRIVWAVLVTLVTVLTCAGVLVGAWDDIVALF